MKYRTSIQNLCPTAQIKEGLLKHINETIHACDSYMDMNKGIISYIFHREGLEQCKAVKDQAIAIYLKIMHCQNNDAKTLLDLVYSDKFLARNENYTVWKDILAVSCGDIMGTAITDDDLHIFIRVPWDEAEHIIILNKKNLKIGGSWDDTVIFNINEDSPITLEVYIPKEGMKTLPEVAFSE